MANENTAPAGGGEGEAPAPVVVEESISLDDAVEQELSQEPDEQPSEASKDEKPQEGEKPAQVEEVKADSESEPDETTDELEIAAAALEAEEGEEDTPAGEDDTKDKQPETDKPLDFETLPGDMRLRLRDNTEVTVGDLKKEWGQLQELKQSQQSFQANVQQVQNEIQQRAAEVEQATATLEMAQAVLQQSFPEIPEQPDIALRSEDPFEYQERVDDRNRAVEAWHENQARLQEIEGQLGQRQQQQTQQQKQLQKQSEKQKHDYIQKQSEELRKVMPVLRDQGKAEEFFKDFSAYGLKSGFTQDEINETYDARVVVMADKARKWDALQDKIKSGKSKPKEAVAKTPVAQPGRMIPQAQEKAAQTNQKFQRALSKGSLTLDEMVDLEMSMENQG